jgi:hypothetical protein
VIDTFSAAARRDRSTAWRPSAWLAVPLLALTFGIAHAQFPLYYLTQNQYFFHGLMRAGADLLRHDWLAGTADPWPLFSGLVEFTSRFLRSGAFFVYYLALLGVYAYSILGIVTPPFGLDRSRLRYLAILLLLIGLHAPLTAAVVERVLGVEDGKELLVGGVASQRILWDMLHPGAFGVFLLLSIYLFLRRRVFWAVAAAAFAASVHPTYMLSAGVLLLSYVIILAYQRQGLRRPLMVAAWSAACMLPVVTYMVVTFRPASPEISGQAFDILARALSRHAVIGEWFDATVVAKIAIIGAALTLVRRTPLFWVMAISAAVATGLTLVQVLTESNQLALIYPWRLSVYLVPLSIVIVAASLLSRVLSWLERRVPAARFAAQAICSVLIVALVGAGAWETARRRDFLATSRQEPVPLYEFVKRTKGPDHVYLIPTKWRYFRLYTGAPVFTDSRFSPYKDTEVLEWQRRVRAAEAFYATSGDGRCQTLAAMSTGRRPTHAVVPAGAPPRCGWVQEFDGGEYRIFRLPR